MNQAYQSILQAGIEKRYRMLEEEIMKDVVRRIQKTGKITSAADWQLQRFMILGHSTEEVEAIIRQATGGDWADTFKLYDEVIEREYVRSRSMYEQINAHFVPYEQNYELQQITNALIRQSSDDLFNISRSMGFMVDMGGGRKVFSPLSEIYNGYLDNAITMMASGAFDYNTMIRRVVGEMTASGLRTVDYASGHSNRVDVAVRRALLTGMGQLTGHISDMNGQKLGTDKFEVDWHPGARPDHAVWQGRVWSRQQLVEVCGLGTGAGLHGWNCRHDYYPFLEGISVRNYSDRWLEEMNRKEARKIPFRGKAYNMYEATQKQRRMETAMRAQREKAQLLQQGGADPDDVLNARCKYQAMLDEYREFSKKFGLPEQRERIYADLRGRVAPQDKSVMKKFPKEMIDNAARDVNQYKRYKKILGSDIGSLANFGQIKYNDSEKWEYLTGLKEYLVKYPNSDRRYYDAGEKLKELGIKKGILLPPVVKQAFIFPEGKHDPNHIMKRMLERNITDDDVRGYMKNAKAMFVQWNGQRQLFVGSEGMCLISRQNDEWIFKTVWSKHDFDEDSEKIMEVLKSVGL